MTKKLEETLNLLPDIEDMLPKEEELLFVNKTLPMLMAAHAARYALFIHSTYPFVIEVLH